MAARSQRTQITQDRVLRELAHIGFLDIRCAFNPDGSLKPLNELDDDTAGAIAGIEITEMRDTDGSVVGYTKRIKIAEKLKALELLGKHLGLFNQKVTINGGDPLTLLIQSIQGSSFQPVVLTKIDACNTK